MFQCAFVANPENEEISLAAVRPEAETGELGVVRELLVRARTVADSELVRIRLIRYQSLLLTHV